MKVIQAPQKLHKPNKMSSPTLFLAGGITGTTNWQDEFIDILKNATGGPPKITIINPRRKTFKQTNKEAKRQIKWEFKGFDIVYSRSHTAIAFWFPKETLCPIALFELGKASIMHPPIFVGCERGYKRTLDIKEQLHLERPEVEVVHSLHDLAVQVDDWISVTEYDMCSASNSL